MDIVLAVLNLLYMFSKRSNFIPRLSFERKEKLLIKLFNIAERWGDPNYGLALIDCCLRKPKLEYLYQLFVEYTDENGLIAVLEIPDMTNISTNSSAADIVKTICKHMSNPSDAIKMRVAHRVRLVAGFKDYKLRLKFVQARLQAVSVLIYSNALQENIDKILYLGFGEELCELIDNEDVHLVEIRAAVLRTLTSMLHFDRNPNVPRPGSRLPKIIQYTGAERQGGILPLLVRDCITSLTGDSPSHKYPLMLATSLFSLLYHLASYEAGGHALVKSGMMHSLLCVISWPGVDLEHITFVTRAVRVIDLITNIDIAKFHQNNGLNVFIDRLEKEVNNCTTPISDMQQETNENSQKESTSSDVQSNQVIGSELERNLYGMDVTSEGSNLISQNVHEMRSSSSTDGIILDHSSHHIIPSSDEKYPSNSYYSRPLQQRNLDFISTLPQSKKLSCVTQRAALLKSMLNFLKKSIQDHAHFSGMRNIMESSLPCSLRHIISNAEYYGPSLFLLATDVVTVYVFNEPSLLSSLQDSGITNVMLQSLLLKDVPATREVLGSLPNIFSALCLNERGLMEFMSYQPFDKILKVLLSPDYLVAMRRRRSSDPLGDTATNLGNAMDDLMKHHPYLRTDATEAIIRLLNELVRLGTDPSFICWRASKENNSSGNNITNSFSNNGVESGNNTFPSMANVNAVSETGSNENENDSSADEDDDDDEMSSASQQQQRQTRMPTNQPQQARTNLPEREAIPLIDYILNIMKFIEAIFSNTSNGDHCREFVLRGGLKPLLQLLSLPNLPIDSPVSTTAQAIANVCKSVLNLVHEISVIDIALEQLSCIVDKMEPLLKQEEQNRFSCGSVLLSEFLNCPKLADGFSSAEYTPLLHNMSAVHGYVVMLVQICRNASNDMRSILLKRWGTKCNTGLELLQKLVQLYISLVWESTLLLSLCSEESYVHNFDLKSDTTTSHLADEEDSKISCIRDSETKTGKFEKISSQKIKIKPEEHLRYIKSLLAASSRLGRALAELFGTLVKLSVGTPQSRQRRNNDYSSNISANKYPTPDAKEIAKVLSSILVNGFNHESILSKPAPKLKLTFLICSVGFTGPMLFDDKRSSFHLMISHFCEENGLKAFFDMFYWALSLKNSRYKFSFENCMRMENALEDSDDDVSDYPEGTGEFIDAWLQLLEKMVNPRAILDSPYAISSRLHNMQNTAQFEPVFYLIRIHQLTLHTIRRIWKRKPILNYGVSMTETIMTILKHLIKSHTMLRERYHVRLNEIKNVNKLVERCQRPLRYSPDEANLNSDHLQILIDMGFSRQYVLDALRSSHSLEQATDYLLNHPEANVGSSEMSSMDEETVPVLETPNSDMDVDVTVNTEIVSQTPSEQNAASTSFSNFKPKPVEFNLISEQIFNDFCKEALETVFVFMEHLPETVSTGVEVISVLYRRLSQTEKEKFVKQIVKDINDWTEYILRGLKHNMKISKVEEFLVGSTSEKLFIRLKTATLLLDEIYADIRKDICDVIYQEQCLNFLMKLLYKTETILDEQISSGAKLINPRWLQALIEFIDAIDNVSVILQRKTNMSAVCSDNWKWYDSSSGKWNSYSEANNLLIKNAFNNGERSVVINIGRQRYTVNFNCMTQVSETSGSHRPVVPSLKIIDFIGNLSENGINSKVENIFSRTIKSKNDGNGVIHEDEMLCLRSLLNLCDHDSCNENKGEPKDGVNVKQDTLLPDLDELFHTDDTSEPSTLKKVKPKLSRKTKFSNRVQKIILHEEAVGLSKFDTTAIISCLVRLLQPTLQLNFETKISILKLCARLTRDYENAKIFVQQGGVNILLNMKQNCGLMGFPTYAIVIIRHTMESPGVLQESIERTLSARTSQSVPVGHRDLIFVLTQVSSAIARHPKLFTAAAKQVLRADYVNNSTFPIDDSRLLVKSQVSGSVKVPTSASVKSDDNLMLAQTSIEVVKQLLQAIIKPCVHYGGISDNEQEVTRDANVISAGSHTKHSIPKKFTEKFEPSCCSWHIPSSAHMHQKPVLPRSTLIKILADAVRSYQSLVPRVIVDHVYTSDDSVLISKEQSCLSFLLDNFIPIVSRQQDSEVSMMSKVLIASLADCNGQPYVQTKLVEEIHNAIVRTLTQSNPIGKHTRLQVFISLLPTMIECPMSGNKIQVQRNNMYRIVLRHGIMTDLLKISQYKDLSNSNTLATMHSILRPIELLLRLTISPGNLSAKRIFFGTAPQGQNSINRRYFPRSTTRTTTNSISGENVLRDIIRNVLSDRRHAFDFIFNTDDLLLDSDNALPNIDTSDEVENNAEENNIATSLNGRSQLTFDRLWDDLLQNENIRLVHRNTNTIANTTSNNGLIVSDHHHHSNAGEENNENASPGSDGASTSSEAAATVADNATNFLGDITTSSESDSDSNLSTENDERNDENDNDDEDDEDDDDGNEGQEDRSETDADDETRQFIEVFDHIYEPESSETASNDADLEADDEASEAGGGVSNVTIVNNTPSQMSMSITLGGEQQVRTSNRPQASEENSNISSAENNSSSSIRTNPTTSWISPRLTFIRPEGNVNFRTNIGSILSNEVGDTTTSTNNDRSQINAVSVTPTLQINSLTNNSQSSGTGVQRRESTRRLVFLDQQYCASMPSYSNPTEEGQIELFNQDVLHWWLEEAKYLDIESQTDICLYVAHLLIPFLLMELKSTHNQLKVESGNAGERNSAVNRRSAIPVLIQQSGNPAVNTQEFEPLSSGTSLNVSNSDTPTDEGSSQLNVSHSVIPSQSDERQDRQIEHNVHVNEMVEIETLNEEEEPLYVTDLTNHDTDDGRGSIYEQNDNIERGNTTAMSDDGLNPSFDVNFTRETQSNIPQSCTANLNVPDTTMEIANDTNESIQSNVITATHNIEQENVVSQQENLEMERTDSISSINETQISTLTISNTEVASVVPNTIRNEPITPEISSDIRAALGDLEVPDGVDPSFLAALPSEMREEVIQEHLRMQRIRQRAQQNAIQVAHDSLLEVNPEFLAALPPNIQSEVLMQQRIEQQRQAAQTANPEDPVDTAAFFQNLPETLRQAILTDMEESQISSLPPELAEEAQYLRRDWENRHGGRLGSIPSNTLSGYLTSRFPSALQNVSNESRWHTNSIWYDGNGTPQSQHHQHTTIIHQQQQLHGKPIALLLMEDENSLPDPDSLATILLFLFVEDPKINHTRFHRVVRNLCYHLPTREWVINALISIVEKTNECKIDYSSRKSIRPQWLKLSVDEAFGYKSNIFIIHRPRDSSQNTFSLNDYDIDINPQAAQMVVRNCLDMLFILAKNFPHSFLPFSGVQKNYKHAEVNASPNEANQPNPAHLTVSADDISGVENRTDEPRPAFQRQQTDGLHLNTIESPNSAKQTNIFFGDLELDNSPSTSKAAAVRHQNKTKLVKSSDLQYNTNAKKFWDVLLNIDIQAHTRLTHIESFPMCSHPPWKWETKILDFRTFNDSIFAKLLTMLPYKVICRSPMLTDMLVKLLASLSNELPKEDELFTKTSSSCCGNHNGASNTSNELSKCNEEAGNDNSSTSANKKQNIKLTRKIYCKIFSQLQLAVEVLTHKCGTTDGLDNISKLIINLSHCSQASNTILLQYLTVAILGLAVEVREAIECLLNEIQTYTISDKDESSARLFLRNATSPVHQGTMQDRFTSKNVVISAPINIKPSCEVQLPAMKKLLSSSSQSYFLRALKIFMQIRELLSTQGNLANSCKYSRKTLSQIICLDDLWNTLSKCLIALEEFKDEYAVLVLQPTVEAFFLIHASHKKSANQSEVPPRNRSQNDVTLQDMSSPTDLQSESNTSGNQELADETKLNSTSSRSKSNTPENLKDINEAQIKTDRHKFLSFAEKHRTVLNQVLRQSTIHLSDGPFAVLVDHTRILDFDVKRKYFQTELERIDEGVRREENTVSVRRITVFEDSFRVLYRLGPEEWKNRFYIVFEDEEGQDAGGLLREWYVIISREIFNPMYALFCVSPGDRVTYMINPSSHANPNHLSYFKFVGRVIAKAVHDNKLLECYFTRSFYKHILGKQVKYTDMESQDYEFYKGLDYLMKNDISTLGYELTFSTEVQEFGVTQVRDLIPNGRDIAVTEENKFDYVQLVCQLKMSGSIRQQLDAFLEGFYDIIPKHLISIFNEQELELLISGLPDIDIEDLKSNTEYHKYTSKSIQIQWFWRALRSFDQADRAKFLQFVTGTSKVPLQGFGTLEGMNGIQKFQIHRDDRSTDRLPCAHTCFNQLDLPMYKSYDKLRNCLLKAIHECSEGFGFA